MKSKISPVTIVLLLLAAGIGALSVLLFRNDPVPVPAAPAPAQPAAKAPVREVPGAVERALRRRIAQLEAELAAARAGTVAATNDAPAVKPIARPDDFRPPSPREMMENLKKNDPKKYEEFRKRFLAMRKRQLERTKGRLDFLESVETAGMTKAERANHEKLQELLAQRENLPDPGEMTDEEMRESMQRRRDLDREIRKASQEERTTLLKQTATALGLEGEDANVFTETIRDVISATELGRHGEPPPGPPPGQR